MHKFIGANHTALPVLEDPNMRRGLSRVVTTDRGTRVLVIGTKPHTEIQALCMWVAHRTLPWFKDPLIEGDLLLQIEKTKAFDPHKLAGW